MAIIYTYPTKATPLGADLVLISDSADGNKSKNATIASLVTSNAIDVVDTLNSLKGDVTITGGTNITLNPSGNNIEINSSGGSGSGTGGFETLPFTTANGYITTDGTYIMQMIAPSDCAPTKFKFYMNLAQLSERTTAVAIYKGDISSGGPLQSKGQIFGASPEKRIAEGTLAAESGATAISAGDSILVCFSMDTNVSPLSVIPITASGSITLTNASPISNDKLALYDTTSIDASEFPATISALQTLLSGATPTTSRPFLFIY